MGGVRVEGRNENIHKTVETGGAGGLEYNVQSVTDPRSGVITVQGCNNNTSSFGHTTHTGDQKHNNTLYQL